MAPSLEGAGCEADWGVWFLRWDNPSVSCADSSPIRGAEGVRRGMGGWPMAIPTGADIESVGRRGHDPALRGAEWESGWRAADCRPFPHRTRRGAY